MYTIAVGRVNPGSDGLAIMAERLRRDRLAIRHMENQRSSSSPSAFKEDLVKLASLKNRVRGLEALSAMNIETMRFKKKHDAIMKRHTKGGQTKIPRKEFQGIMRDTIDMKRGMEGALRAANQENVAIIRKLWIYATWRERGEGVLNICKGQIALRLTQWDRLKAMRNMAKALRLGRF